MIRIGVRLGLAGAGGLALLAKSAAVAVADASFVPGMPSASTTSAADGLVLPLVVLVVALLAFVLLRRSTSTRVGAGYLLGMGAFVIGLISVLAGFFGDLSGQRRIIVVPLVFGVVAIAGSAIALWRFRRGARGSTIPPETSHS